jgi:hypothetical protein
MSLCTSKSGFRWLEDTTPLHVAALPRITFRMFFQHYWESALREEMVF